MNQSLGVYYFAYGSNMSSRRLEERVGSVNFIEICLLHGWRWVMNKPGRRDGTAKANLIKDNGSKTWGVVFQVTIDQIVTLDSIEEGYDRIQQVACNKHGGQEYEVEVFVSTVKPVKDQRPTEEYRSYILEGAREHNLPKEFIAEIENLETLPSNFRA